MVRLPRSQASSHIAFWVSLNLGVLCSRAPLCVCSCLLISSLEAGRVLSARCLGTLFCYQWVAPGPCPSPGIHSPLTDLPSYSSLLIFFLTSHPQTGPDKAGLIREPTPIQQMEASSNLSCRIKREDCLTD